MAFQTSLPGPPHVVFRKARRRSQRNARKSSEHATDGQDRWHLLLHLLRDRHLPWSCHYRRKSRPIRNGVWTTSRFHQSRNRIAFVKNDAASSTVEERPFQAAEKLRLGSGWEGHDFSRAVKSFKTNRASAPAGCLRHQSEFFSSLLEVN